MANRELERMIEDEVARHPDVGVEWTRRGHHPAVVLKLNGRSRFVPYSSTRVKPRCMLNNVAQVKQAIRALREAR